MNTRINFNTVLRDDRLEAAALPTEDRRHADR